MDGKYSSICPDSILSLLHVERPALLFFASVVKTNDHYRPQKRLIAVTKAGFFNIKRGWFWGYSIKRVISLNCIQGLIRNPNTQEFVIKVNSSIANDYHYTGDCWEPLTEVLLTLIPGLSVWTITTRLDDFVKRKGDSVTKRENGLLRFEPSKEIKRRDTIVSTCCLSIVDLS